jgi:type IV secretory pathway VirD2 relaxase
MKQSTDAYIERLKAQLSATETALYKAKMSAQEVNTRKNLQIAELQARIEELQKALGRALDLLGAPE